MSKKYIIVILSIVFILFATNSYSKSINDAVYWAENQIGSNWDSQCGHAWAYWCMHFCGHAYGKVPSGVVTAIAGWNGYDSVFGSRHNDHDIPVGALVFFGTSLYVDGHVGVYIGNGKMIHAWTSGVREDYISRFESHYLGWRWPEAWTTDDPCDDCGEKPDLVVRELYLTNNQTEFTSCEEIPIKIYTRIKNKGDADVTHDIEIEYYLSSGEKLDDNPIFTKHDEIDEKDLEADESEKEDKGFAIPTTPGTYNIVVCADTKNDIDEESESNNCSDPLVFNVRACNYVPQGYIESATCEKITGWIKDPDASSPIKAHFYANAPYGSGGTYLGSITANEYYPNIGNYGFNFLIPESLKDGYLHRIYVYAIDSAGGVNPNIGFASILCVQPEEFGFPVYRQGFR